MRFQVAAVALLLAGTMAGCITDESTDPSGDADGLLEQVPVFDDPRTRPHQAFGWPTATAPYSADGRLVNPWLAPIDPADLPETITGMEHLAQPADVVSGAGIAVFGRLAVIPGHGSSPTAILDISDPAAATIIGSIDHHDKVTARDVDVIVHPDGRITLVFATNEGVVPVYDITDPTNPVHLTDIEPSAGAHNVAIVPGTPILYNANSAGASGTAPLLGLPENRLPDSADGITEIYDLTDPEAPELVQDWHNGYGCHDITFWLSDDGQKNRAYCAGIQMTQIWDIADPLAPIVVSNIPVHYGTEGGPSAEVFLVNFAHLAMVSHDADVLIVGDETGGGLLMGCDAYIDAQVQTASGPLGNLWFYDLSDETDPQLKSWFSPNPSYITNPPTPEQEAVFGWPGCTAHFGRNIDDRDQLVMAFYGAGILLVDYSDVAHPVIVDQWIEPGTNAWDVWYYQGYLFTGDLARGMDVLSLT